MQGGRERDPDDRAFVRLKPSHRLTPRLLAAVVQEGESSPRECSVAWKPEVGTSGGNVRLIGRPSDD